MLNKDLHPAELFLGLGRGFRDAAFPTGDGYPGRAEDVGHLLLGQVKGLADILDRDCFSCKHLFNLLFANLTNRCLFINIVKEQDDIYSVRIAGRSNN